MRNERNAGRKLKHTREEMLVFLQRNQNGEMLSRLAREAGVSRQTMYNYFAMLADDDKISQLGDSNSERLVCKGLSRWKKLNDIFQTKDDIGEYILRMDYMNNNQCMTSMLLDIDNNRMLVHNETNDLLHRAFGINVAPDWENLIHFLESRCYPEDRDGIDEYDPFATIEKTQGRMAEDNQWIRITYLDKEAE